MKCVVCNKELVGKQKKFCSKVCKNKTTRSSIQVCSNCGRLKEVQRKNNGNPLCKSCCKYMNKLRRCSICGEIKESATKDICKKCYAKSYKAPNHKCSICNQYVPAHKKINKNTYICKRCYKFEYKPPKKKCFRCGKIRILSTKTLCYSCRNKERCEEDYNFATRMKLRKKVSKFVRGGIMRKSLISLIDYEQISNYIGRSPGDNYHIDHIFPLVAFDLTNEDHVRAAFAPENHQWLIDKDNLSKKDRYDSELFLNYLSCFKP